MTYSEALNRRFAQETRVRFVKTGDFYEVSCLTQSCQTERMDFTVYLTKIEGGKEGGLAIRASQFLDGRYELVC